MIVQQMTDVDYGNKFTYAHYETPRDLIKQAERGFKLHGGGKKQSRWAGGTFDHFKRGLTGRVRDYVAAADAKMKHFSNVALEDYAVEHEYNTTYGVLDYSALVAGNPACMYGATVTETDRSPIDIYVDTWVQAGVKADVIEARGIALLALIQVLSIYRPVNTFILKGSRHLPVRKDTVQTLQIPTAPMDLARATFLLCSPTVNRHGLLNSINSVHNSKRECGSPPMSRKAWQDYRMPKWMAKRRGVSSYLHMTGMFDRSLWLDDANTVDWIKKQIAKFL